MPLKEDGIPFASKQMIKNDVSLTKEQKERFCRAYTRGTQLVVSWCQKELQKGGKEVDQVGTSPQDISKVVRNRLQVLNGGGGKSKDKGAYARKWFFRVKKTTGKLLGRLASENPSDVEISDMFCRQFGLSFSASASQASKATSGRQPLENSGVIHNMDENYKVDLNNGFKSLIEEVRAPRSAKPRTTRKRKCRQECLSAEEEVAHEVVVETAEGAPLLSSPEHESVEQLPNMMSPRPPTRTTTPTRKSPRLSKPGTTWWKVQDASVEQDSQKTLPPIEALALANRMRNKALWEQHVPSFQSDALKKAKGVMEHVTHEVLIGAWKASATNSGKVVQASLKGLGSVLPRHLLMDPYEKLSEFEKRAVEDMWKERMKSPIMKAARKEVVALAQAKKDADAAEHHGDQSRRRPQRPAAVIGEVSRRLVEATSSRDLDSDASLDADVVVAAGRKALLSGLKGSALRKATATMKSMLKVISATTLCSTWGTTSPFVEEIDGFNYHSNNIGVGTIINHFIPVEDKEPARFTGVIVGVGEAPTTERPEEGDEACWLVDYMPWHPEDSDYAWQPISQFIASGLRVVDGPCLNPDYKAPGGVLCFRENWYDMKEPCTP